MSQQTLTSLEPRLLWHHFDAVSKIPRPSGHEKKISEYLIGFATKKGLPTISDQAGNLVIKVPASPGKENSPTVIVQSHMDMVCEKNTDTKHDFFKDPIKTAVEGDFVKAVGTTLGADDGIGLSGALALVDDKDCIHGPLELLFTVDEEIGLAGVNKLDPSIVSGRLLLNLDCGEDGVITIGCSGGVTSIISLKCQVQKTPAGVKAFEIKVGGLAGGHSGRYIHANRHNAIKLLSVALHRIVRETGALIFLICGGDKHNAIPREALARIVVPRDKAPLLKEITSGTGDFFKSIATTVDKDLKVEVREFAGRPRQVWTKQSGLKVLRLLKTLPHGVAAVSRDMPGLVETSNNLAAIKTVKNGIEITTSSRSMVKECMDLAIDTIETSADIAGADFRNENRYPGWKPDPCSQLLCKAKEAYKISRGTEPVVQAVHVGLECGILIEKLPGTQAIAFGPTILQAHSPTERVQISSVGNFYTLLRNILKTLVS